MSQPRIVAMMGKPGSGKGTQTELFAEKSGYRIVSSGALFREYRDRDDELGQRVRAMYDKGLLMPGWFASYLLLRSILESPLSENIVFEGAFRTLSEAELFEEMMVWLEDDYEVFNILVSDEESIKRNLKRGRGVDDESEEKIRARIDQFNKLTQPSIDFFESKGRVVRIDGNRPVEDVHKDILDSVGL